MYDEVYKAMRMTGVAIRLPNATWVDKNQAETTEELARKSLRAQLCNLIMSHLIKNSDGAL
jgi:hypothetical protein